MKITRRIIGSAEEATAQLDRLATETGIAQHCYAESAADSMSEFDAIKWTALCAQRRVLLEREKSKEKASTGDQPQ